MPEVTVTALRPEPLGSYLKALALLRLVATQADREAEGWWASDRFHLRSELDLDDLVGFLTERYCPTPLVAPWNGGSGFGPNDKKASPTAVAAVELVASSEDPRLATYRRAIAAVRELVARPGWHELAKEQQVALCRNHLPDQSIPWIDAAVVLTAEHRRFPPLLGTGGNDGRLDFSSNFLQRLAECFALADRPSSATPIDVLAQVLITGEPAPLDRSVIGQFDPGAAGGVGSGPLGAAPSLANPWDLVLVLEGAIVFASAAARRLSTGRAAVGVPFMVDSSPAGHASAAPEGSRGELWAPIWERPATFSEIERLVGEGRAEYRGRQARSGLDFARAAVSLGTERGIGSFTRHAFLERNGLATLAVPVGHLRVRERSEVGLTSALDPWINRLRRVANPPASLIALLREFDDAVFEVTTTDRPADALLRVLEVTARLDRLAQRSSSFRDLQAPSGLRADKWLDVVHDSSVESTLAISLASLRVAPWEKHGVIRALVASGYGAPRPPLVPGLGTRRITDVLGEVHHRMSLDRPPERGAHGRAAESPGTAGAAGWLPGLWRHRVDPRAAIAVASGDLDDDRLERLLSCYLLLDWSGWSPPSPVSELGEMIAVDVNTAQAWCLLILPFFQGSPPRSYRTLAPPCARPAWVRALSSGRIGDVTTAALRSLTIAGIEPLLPHPRRLIEQLQPLAPRLAAALLVPVGGAHVTALLDRVCTRPSAFPETTPMEVHEQ